METERKSTGAMVRESLISAWKGEAGKTYQLAFWLPVLWVLWGACFAWAAHCYHGYQISDHDISDLGNPAKNPKGWWYWSLGMGIAAFMIFPPIAFASRRMEELTSRHTRRGKRLVSIGTICMRCACFGMAGLALVPQNHNLDIIHVISGVFAFGGVYVTLLFFWSVPLFKVQEMSVARLVLFTVSAWWAVVGFLTTQGYRFFAYGEVGHALKHRRESVFLRFSLWEWMLFVALTTSFAILVALLPSKSETDA